MDSLPFICPSFPLHQPTQSYGRFYPITLLNKQWYVYFGVTPHTTCCCHHPSNTSQSETISGPQWELAPPMGTTSVQVPAPHLEPCNAGPITQPLHLSFLKSKMKIIVAQPHKVVDRFTQAFSYKPLRIVHTSIGNNK